MPALAQNPSEGRRLTPEEYIKANYEPQDHLAVLIHHRAKGDTIQRVNTAEALASSKWQGWLRHVNANGYDVYISQNTLNGDSRPSPQTGCGGHPPRVPRLGSGWRPGVEGHSSER